MSSNLATNLATFMTSLISFEPSSFHTFSVDYLFPDDGTHQVLLRIDKNDSINVASFNVFVPHQSPPSILDNQGNLIIGIGILAIVGTITIIILKKK